ncbi:MAG: hypothetical protein ABSB35_09400 [Bryobacteraceae bacterium]|jgi:hypothetical protein
MKLNRNIERRLTELEYRVGGSEITLLFEDGSSRVILLSRGRDTPDVFAEALRNPDSEEASAIKRSVFAIEPHESKLIELCRAILQSPAEINEIGERKAVSK